MNYKNILFDMDGTLTDSKKGVIDSMLYTLKQYGIKAPDGFDMQKCVGPPLTYSFSSFFGLSETEVVRAVSVYRQYYEKKGMFEAALYGGIPELLEKLKTDGKTLIMSTSKTELYARQIAEHFGIAKYFSFIAGASMDTARIKKNDVIDYALKECKINDLSSCVLVGDRMHDIEGAKLSGIDSIGVLYGYGSKEELEEAGCSRMAENTLELYDMLTGK